MTIYRNICVILLAFLWVDVCPLQAKTKSPESMIVSADRALQKDPNDAKAYYNRGTAHYNLGDYEAAVKDLAKSISLEPNAPDVYFNRGLSLRRQRKIREAI